MPNHCQNDVVFSHKDPKMAARLLDAAERGELFEEFVPTPKTDDDSWYAFHIENWGTKWDAYNTLTIQHPESDKIIVSFTTAWNPPIQWYEKMAALDFQIEALYNEPGMCFCGIWNNEEGDFSIDYHSMTANQAREVITSELDDQYNIVEFLEEC